jgi:carbon storage regulator
MQMLVLTRKRDERLFIGDDIQVVVLRIQGNRITLGIQAPDGVRIIRAEIADLPPQPPRRTRRGR